MTWHDPTEVRLELGLPLPAALRLIANNGPAATVAACLMLKTLFLALHLLALSSPRCSGLERLALLHWSFDVWNVWCLAEFVRRGRLPWGLETCVLYHVVGYIVYTLVYLYLQNREWAERGELSRMAATPDSEVTVRISEAEEEDEEGPVATREPFGTPGRDGIISEDVPDEESAAEDREDRQKPAAEDNNRQPTASGRDALCAIPEDAPLPEPGTGAPDSAPQDQSESKDLPQDQQPQDGKEASGAPRDDSSPERRQPDASPAGDRPYRKLDAAGELLRRSPTAMDGGRSLDITQDVAAAALKAGREVTAMLNAGRELMAAMHAAPQHDEVPKPTEEEPKPSELGGTEERPQQNDDQAARRDGAAEDGGGDQSGGQNGVNGSHNGVQNGAQNGDRSGNHNGDGAPEEDRGEAQDRDHGQRRNGELNRESDQ